MEIKASKEKANLKGTLEIEMEVLRRKSYIECLDIIDIHLKALRSELRSVLVEEIFTRGGKG